MRKKPEFYNLILSALFSGITAICAWITIPTAIPFTLQTLAIFLMAQLLPLKYSLISVGIYIAMGIVGLPVFSGFQGGAGVLLGPTGGYITGFVFIILITGLVAKRESKKPFAKLSAMTSGLLLCYLFGTLWFMLTAKATFLSAVIICVVPYVVFDIAKMALSVILCNRLKKFLKNY
jgi:biotin transport system substrate-specific component